MLHMPRVAYMLEIPEFLSHLAKIEQLESERIFCKHGLDHALSVARIAWSYLLELGERNFTKEVVYVTGLLHDIGRWIEYETGEDHAEASARLAQPLLAAAGFDVGETESILAAIREHRQDPKETGLTALGRAIALADDWARDCWQCKVKDSCYKYNDSMKQMVF